MRMTLQGLVAVVVLWFFSSSLYAGSDEVIAGALHNKELIGRMRNQRPALREATNLPLRDSSSRSAAMTQNTQSPFEHHIREASRQYGVDPDLIRAVIDVESSGRPHALSSAGARGLMQVLPETAGALGIDPRLLWDERTNILTGTRYLRVQLKSFGNVRDALIAYNSGPDTIHKDKPIPSETKAYVPKVLKRYRAYKLAGKQRGNVEK